MGLGTTQQGMVEQRSAGRFQVRRELLGGPIPARRGGIAAGDRENVFCFHPAHAATLQSVWLPNMDGEMGWGIAISS